MSTTGATMTTKIARLSLCVCVGLLASAGCDDDDDGGPAATAPDAGRADAGGTIGGGDGGPSGADANPGGGDGGTAAQPRGAANPPPLGVQIDRAGRPAISTALIQTFNADDAAKRAAKDAYNAAAPATWSTFVQPMRQSLAILDALDGTCGNQLVADMGGMGRYSFLATVLADDQLYVNAASSKCGIYLGLEAEIVNPALPAELKGSCGGRMPGDDVIERSYSVLAAGVLSGVDDGVKVDDAASDPTTFPWLAAPK